MTLKMWEEETQKLAYYFVSKYFGEDVESYWVGDEVGDVLYVNDYFFDLDFILTAVRHKATEKQVFDFYDYMSKCATSGVAPKTNFRNYIKYGAIMILT